MCVDRSYCVRADEHNHNGKNNDVGGACRVDETTTTYEAGTVDTYSPGKTIVVKREHEGPLSFALGTAARVVDGAGKIVTAPLRSGQKVRVYYTGTGEKRVVERVQVDD